MRALGLFVERHFGSEPLQYMVSIPFVSGIYAGDPSRLSLRHTFPLLYELEKEYGSVIKGGRERSKERKTARRREEETESLFVP